MWTMPGWLMNDNNEISQDLQYSHLVSLRKHIEEAGTVKSRLTNLLNRKLLAGYKI